MNQIVTCDETWVNHYTPENKRTSMEWQKNGEGAPVNAKPRLSAGKVLATCLDVYKRQIIIGNNHIIYDGIMNDRVTGLL